MAINCPFVVFNTLSVLLDLIHTCFAIDRATNLWYTSIKCIHVVYHEQSVFQHY